MFADIDFSRGENEASQPALSRKKLFQATTTNYMLNFDFLESN